MKRKKSELKKVYIYIIATVIIVLLFLLVITIRYISIIGPTPNEQMSVVQFKIDMKNVFDKVRPNYMSKIRENFSVPDGIKNICFVDQELVKDKKIDKNTTGLCNKDVNNGIDYNALMCDAWDGSAAENVFCEPPLNTPIYVGKIKINDTGYKCFNAVSGQFDVELIGLGDSVKIN